MKTMRLGTLIDVKVDPQKGTWSWPSPIFTSSERTRVVNPPLAFIFLARRNSFGIVLGIGLNACKNPRDFT